MKLLKKIFVLCLYVLPIGVVFYYVRVTYYPISTMNIDRQFINEFEDRIFITIIISIVYLVYSFFYEFYKRYYKYLNPKQQIKKFFFVIIKNFLAAFLAEMLIMASFLFSKPLSEKTSYSFLLLLISVYLVWFTIIVQILYEPIPKIIKRYITGNEQFIGLFLRTFNIFFIYFFALVSALFTLHNDWLNIFYCVVFNLSTIGVFWKLNKKQTQ